MSNINFYKQLDIRCKQIIKEANGKCQIPSCTKVDKLTIRPLGPLWAICSDCLEEFERQYSESLESIRRINED